MGEAYIVNKSKTRNSPVLFFYWVLQNLCVGVCVCGWCVQSSFQQNSEVRIGYTNGGNCTLGLYVYLLKASSLIIAIISHDSATLQ